MIAISIALAINKQVVIGVIYNPVLDLLYSTVRGKGAFKNGRPIKCSGQTGTTNCFVHLQIYILLTDLALSQVAGEYGSSREPAILTAKCQNLRVIIEKVHRQIKFKTKSK
jgi:fructose-1,6-bisphosphatase/inositol monophosphatase family enzyme